MLFFDTKCMITFDKDIIWIMVVAGGLILHTNFYTLKEVLINSVFFVEFTKFKPILIRKSWALFEFSNLPKDAPDIHRYKYKKYKWKMGVNNHFGVSSVSPRVDLTGMEINHLANPAWFKFQNFWAKKWTKDVVLWATKYNCAVFILRQMYWLFMYVSK